MMPSMSSTTSCTSNNLHGLHAAATLVKRVLLISDDTPLIDTLRGAISAAGWEVSLARSGHAALELAHRIQPDLAILDSSVRYLPASTVAVALRCATPQLPVVALARPGEDRL